MQSLDVISVNLWQILISLANLVILFLILKKFLYKPVRRVLSQREEALGAQYAAAQRAEEDAQAQKAAWEQKMQHADEEAGIILQKATDSARFRGDKIIGEAQDKADGIVRAAQAEAELTRKQATDGIRREIVDVSAALTEKMIGREINLQDHRALIDSFIDEIGDGDDRDE